MQVQSRGPHGLEDRGWAILQGEQTKKELGAQNSQQDQARTWHRRMCTDEPESEHMQMPKLELKGESF